ncbi:MAG: MarR family winged helix-turn-helix transcriptional regulator [Candidatus Methylomirabilia bacterium]
MTTGKTDLRIAREALTRPAVSHDAQRLLELLHALGSTTFRQFLWQKAAELELTYAQSQVLSYVAQHPGCHMGEVAKAFGVTLPAITQIVDRLEQKKFLTRGTDPADRRVYTLEVTEEGKALVNELYALQIEGLEPVLARMPTRDRNRLITGLETLVEAAAQEEKKGRGRGDPRRLISD